MAPKAGNLRAKNVDYEDDELYSDEDNYGDEGDAMTDEDREQLRIGTACVREALDADTVVTDAQIQEALWNYYYDVGKSVTYLKNKFGPKQAPQPKKQKATSRFDQAASAAGADATPTPVFPLTILLDDDFMTAEDFFADTPWGKVPADRLGHITQESLFPRGGLLGGSKLAALAAARKKKQEEAKHGSTTATSSLETKDETDKAISLLDRLNVGKDNASKASTGDEQESAKKSFQSKYPRKRADSPETTPEEPEEPPAPEPLPPPIDVSNLRTQPSIFASTLCGDASIGTPRQRLDSLQLPMPPNATPNSATLKDNIDPFAGPSPDDIVLRAQRKGTKPKPKKQDKDQLAESIEKLAVDEAPKVKSKNLNVVEEFEKSGMKRMANFVVVGHVDHGKSTLMGRLLYDLNVIDQRSVDKLRKEAESIGKSSFALAWVMDQTSEERNRGVTVDIATNYFETEQTRFTILDAPGHKDFIPNMIAGASQADFAVLVIDSSINSFESGLKGQTKEHALLVRSLGVQRLIVAVNKMDTVSWSQERFEEISTQMTSFLTTASFLAKNITFVPCAGLTGENVTRKVEDPNAKWYNGETLVEALDTSEPAKRNVQKPFRFTIGDVFRGGILNPISISGRIEAGSVQVGDVIRAMPASESATVKGIEVEQEPVDWAVAGQLPTLHLCDIDPIHLRLGDIACDPKNPVENVKSFTCKILAFDHVMPMSVDVFRGRLQAEGRITKLEATLNKTSGEVLKKKPRVIQPADVARVVVELEKELPLEAGVRVVLREAGNTVAAGLLES